VSLTDVTNDSMNTNINTTTRPCFPVLYIWSHCTARNIHDTQSTVHYQNIFSRSELPAQKQFINKHFKLRRKLTFSSRYNR